MRTYIYQETGSPVRGCNVRVTVYRIKRNRPHIVGHVDMHTASWKGAHGQAVSIIHDVDGIPYAEHHDGTLDRYALRGELSPAEKYDDTGHPRNAVRLFGI